MLLAGVMPYVILSVFGGFSIIRIFSDSSNAIVTIFLNILFGGSLYLMLNICGFIIPFNMISACCVSFLGFPGVILLIILKIVFRIF